MKSYNRLFAGLIMAALISTQTLHNAATVRADERPKPVVQIAILLDTSGSMSGLIEQTKTQLWKIVNEFAAAKQNGERPELQLALFEYGNSGLSSEQGWIRRIQPLTTDLDKISEELFALTTNGGDEFCGWVIQTATETLEWSNSSDDYKAIFIAGNEPFTQGPVDYAAACKAAIQRGIMINTIHCGNEAEGIGTKWQHGAVLAEGKYMFIDHNRAVVHFEAPQDKEIARLGVELNRTYIPYGSSGTDGEQRQSVQDANSALFFAQGAAVNRALFKATANYCNFQWDLVDACAQGTVDLAELKSEDLPEAMRPMTPPERKAYVDSKARERAKIQEQINRLNSERLKYLAAKSETGATGTLDNAIITAIQEQAARKHYRFE